MDLIEHRVPVEMQGPSGPVHVGTMLALVGVEVLAVDLWCDRCLLTSIARYRLTEMHTGRSWVSDLCEHCEP